MPEERIYKILIYVSIIAWFFPIFRQYRTTYFPLFLFLGSADIVHRIIEAANFRYNIIYNMFLTYI